MKKILRPLSVGVFRDDDGTLQELGLPQVVNYQEAEEVILEWQSEKKPAGTIILLDQPTIVRNSKGQRPVEGTDKLSAARR